MSPQRARTPAPEPVTHAPRRRSRLAGIMAFFAMCCLLAASGLLGVLRIAGLIDWSWWVICAPVGVGVLFGMGVVLVLVRALSEIDEEMRGE